MQTILKPYNLLGLAGVFSMLLPLFSDNSTVDIHFHDTYYIVSPNFLFSRMAAFLWFAWLVYKLSDRILFSKRPMGIHPAIMLLMVAVFTINIFRLYSFRHINYSGWTSFYPYQNTSSSIVVALYVSVIAQLLFVINIVGGVLRTINLRQPQ